MTLPLGIPSTYARFPGFARLHRKWWQTANLVLQGLSNQEMAKKLELTEKGVTFRMSAIYREVGIQGRSRDKRIRFMVEMLR